MDISSITLNKTLIKWIVGAAAVIVVLAVFLGGYGGLNNLMQMFGTPLEVTDDFGGALLFSAVTKSTKTNEVAGMGNFILSVKDNYVLYIPVDQLNTGPAVTLQYGVSSDTIWATFLGTSLATSTKDKTPSIYSASLTSSTYDGVINALQSATPVASPTEADYFRELPVISRTGAVLYSSLAMDTYAKFADDIGNIQAENWNIYILHSSGKKQLLAKGLQPKWIDDNRFAYLKNDGIYLYNIVTNESNKVQDLNYTPTLANGFDVSDDGQYIAISTPITNTLSVIRVLDWDSALLAAVADIAVTATYPVFSPNDKYLAMLSLEADSNDPTQQTGVGTIKYFSLEKKEFISTVFPIDPAIVAGIYITDWR